MDCLTWKTLSGSSVPHLMTGCVMHQGQSCRWQSTSRLPTLFFFHDTTLSFSLLIVCLSLYYSAYLTFMLNVLQKLRTCLGLAAHCFSCKIELRACKDWSQQASVWALVALSDCREPCSLRLLGPRECVSLQERIGHWLARTVNNPYSLQCPWGRL